MRLTWSESESHSVVSDSLRPHGLNSPWNSLGQNTGVGSLYLLQRVFPTQGSNPGHPHCRWILYQLSHKGRPRILQWVDYPFSSGPPQPINWTGVSFIAGGFFTNWAIREATLLDKAQAYDREQHREVTYSKEEREDEEEWERKVRAITD